MIRCSCGVESRDPSSWRKHYEETRPVNASARKEHVRAHVPVIVYPPKVDRPAREARPQDVRLAKIRGRIRDLYDRIMFLEIEELNLLRELSPTPPPPQVVETKWYKASVRGTCKTCAARTMWMRGGIYRCQNDVHVDEVVTRRVSGVVSDAVWKILSDEEVDS